MNIIFNKENRLITILSIAILLYLAIPLFLPGLPSNNDLELYPGWLTEFEQNIKDGNLIPRWSPNAWYGLGAPIFNFVSPGFYYLAEFFRLFHFNILISVKLAIYFSLVIGYIFMFLFTKKIWGRWPALLCATLYTFFPYHLGLIFTRGDYAELLAMGLFPLNLFLFYNLVTTRRPKYFILAALAIFAQMIAHNLLSILFIPVLLLFILFFTKKKKPLTNYLLPLSSFLLGVLMASFFWLPAFLEKNYINLDELTTGIHINSGHYDFHNNFISWLQLIHIKAASFADDIPFWLSYFGLAVILASVFLVIKKFKQPDKRLLFIKLFTLILFVYLFMVTSLSVYVWETISPLKLIQFPGRLLSIVALAIGSLAGLIVFFFKGKTLKAICTILTILFIVSAVRYTWFKEYMPYYGDEFYTLPQIIYKQVGYAVTQANLMEALEDVNTYSMEPAIVYQNVSIPILLSERAKLVMNDAARLKAGENVGPSMFNKFENSEDLSILQSRLQSTEYYLKVEAKASTQLLVNTIWFPGWKVWIDGYPLDSIQLTPNLRTMRFEIPAGEHTVLVKYTDTKIRVVSKIISLISLIAVFIIYILYYRSKRLEKEFDRYQKKMYNIS